MRIGVYDKHVVGGNSEDYNLLLPPRFVGKYKKLLARAGYKITRVIKNPFRGVAVDYTIRGHQVIMVKVADDEQYAELYLLLHRWEKMLENEN